jgi:hypothetical protein
MARCESAPYPGAIERCSKRFYHTAELDETDGKARRRARRRYGETRSWENILEALLKLEALEHECARITDVVYLLEPDFVASPVRRRRVREFPIGLMRSLRSGLETR